MSNVTGRASSEESRKTSQGNTIKKGDRSRIVRDAPPAIQKSAWSPTAGGHSANTHVGHFHNAFDETTRKWRQTWVDDTGGVLLLAGEFKNGTMILEGDQRNADGGTTRQRISWTPLPGARVRQLWESTSDGGKRWKTEFDGIYTPRHAPGDRTSSQGYRSAKGYAIS